MRPFGRVGADAEAALQAKTFIKRSEGARSALNLGGTADGIIRPELSSREFGAFLFRLSGETGGICDVEQRL